ncbi:hypothetical protein C8R44DRAFT_796863 [Mycena epipterygia]|nr:hypothetical protein C8R44DRAFT_796863 [Mycena epipterygia]
MPRRKRNVAAGGEAITPTSAQWAKMTPYGSFAVEDHEGDYCVFKLGDTAAVLPDGTKVGAQLPVQEHWIARILAIRGRTAVNSLSRKKTRPHKDEGQSPAPDIWVRVRWFYSPKEAEEKIQGFFAEHCSPFERIYSRHCDIISSQTFNEVVSVTKYYEDSVDQAPIEDEQIFTRYFLKESAFQQWEILSYASRTSTHLEDSVSCICGGPYDLNATGSLNIMHMCPRPHCRRFYHVHCLLEYGHWTPKLHPFIHLLSSPDTDTLPVLSLCKHESNTVNQYLPALPDELLRLAAQPIVRGAAIPTLGITGNSRNVVVARRIVYAALQKGTPVPHGWEEDVDLDAAIVDCSLPLLKLMDSDELLVFMCPNCSGPI